MSVRIACVGLGYWGKNYPRVLRDTVGATPVALVDPDAGKVMAARRAWPDVPAFTSIDEMLAEIAVDAAIIATPAETHFGIVSRCIDSGLHVLVEKPLARDLGEARKMDEAARAADRVLLVGHTFLYSRAVEAIRDLVLSGELGDVRYMTSRRLNLGRVRNDVDALWNFGPHDVSIAMYVLGDRKPVLVDSHFLYCLDRPVADVAFVNLQFERNVSVHMHMSWLDPRRVRELTVIGSKAMLYYDDTNSREPIRIYRVGVEPNAPGLSFDNWAEFQMNVRSGDIHIPMIRNEEPLVRLCNHFVRCITGEDTPRTPGRHGVEVVRVLEAATKSASQRGVGVKLAPE